MRSTASDVDNSDDITLSSSTQASDVESLTFITSIKKRKARGRPPTSGDYMDMAAAKEVWAAAKDKELRVREYEARVKLLEKWSSTGGLGPHGA